jgi:hypothetical protein
MMFCDVTLSVHPHRASWKVSLATVGIEPATFGMLVQDCIALTVLLYSPLLFICSEVEKTINLCAKPIQDLSRYAFDMIDSKVCRLMATKYAENVLFSFIF